MDSAKSENAASRDLPDRERRVKRMPRPQRWDTPFSDEMTDAQVDRILATEFFSQIDASAFPSHIPLRGVVLNDTCIREYAKGDIIVREGDYGNSAFWILSGTVSVVLKRLPAEVLGRSRPEKVGAWAALTQSLKKSRYPETRYYDRRKFAVKRPVGTQIFLQDVPGVVSGQDTDAMTAGEIFGEIGAMTRTPRTATVVADEPSILLEIRWQGLRELRNFAPQFKAQIDHLYRERSLQTHFRATPFLSELPEGALQQVVRDTAFHTYGNFDWFAQYKANEGSSAADRLKIEPLIVSEGDYPNGLILVRNGFVRVSQKYNHGERTLRYVGKGEIYGLAELGSNWLNGGSMNMQQTLRAIGYVDILFIPTATVEKYIFSHWKRKDLEAVVARDLKVIGFNESASLRDDVLENFVENRVINGTQTMLVDMDRCTRCDDCVRACASVHDNNPRFVRDGPVIEQTMIAHACMHCMDPVCMIGCPTGAIHRETAEGQVVINDSTCIGCGTCANSCPYDNIKMVSIRDHSGQLILSEELGTPIQKATKCDLCVDQLAGPACVRACPHDAMHRVDVSQIGELANFFSR